MEAQGVLSIMKLVTKVIIVPINIHANINECWRKTRSGKIRLCGSHGCCYTIEDGSVLEDTCRKHAATFKRNVRLLI